MLVIREEGAGAPLVLVHGAGTSSAIWHRVMPRLADGRRVVAPDLPGYGGSPAAGPGFALEEVADGLAAGLAEAGVPAPYDLVGHSMGGAIAILLATHHPERVRRLVLVAPAGLAALPRVAAGLLGAVAAPFAVARRTLATPLAGNALVRRLALAGVARDGARVPPANARAVLASSAGATRIGPGLASAATADLRATLAGVRTPLGLVWGEHDPVIPPRRIEVIRRARPDVEVQIVSDTAHAPMLERPDAFCTALDAVLAQLARYAREGTVTLPDGRRLAWSSGGDDDGVPVLYLHGAIGTPVRRTAELDLLIADLGLRHLAVSRPGFGRSDPCPGRRIADFPADVEYLADRLGLGRFAVVGVSAGGPYAIACARALHDRVVATAAVSSLSPLCPPHAGRWMPAHIRLGLRALARRPDLAARGGTRVVRMLERHPHALTRVATLGATPADRRLLADGQMGETAIESFLAAAAGGVQGMIEDYVTCCTAWGFDLGEVLGEVHLWHGERDRFVPVEHARALAAALPRCRARFDAEDGHFFFRRRVAEVLGALVAAAQPPKACAAAATISS